MEKYIGTYNKSSPFIQNLLKKQICSFEILWQNYPPPGLQIFSNLPLDSCLHVLAESPHFADFLNSATHCRFTEICKQKSPQYVKGIVANSAIVISTTPWAQHISFALGYFNLFQQTR